MIGNILKTSFRDYALYENIEGSFLVQIFFAAKGIQNMSKMECTELTLDSDLSRRDFILFNFSPFQ